MRLREVGKVILKQFAVALEVAFVCIRSSVGYRDSVVKIVGKLMNSSLPAITEWPGMHSRWAPDGRSEKRPSTTSNRRSRRPV